MKMNRFNTRFYAAFALVAMAVSACDKKERPALGDYPEDTNPPGGPLSFYVAFDGTSADPNRNAVDSIRANFPASNPLATADGVSGKGVQGDSKKEQAIRYVAPNDFGTATSFSVSYWMKHVPQTDGEPEFHFSLASKDYWHQSGLFLLVEKAGPDASNSTPSQMACTFAIEDFWLEFRGDKRLPKALDGNWHHLVFVYDETDSKVRVYVDGALVQTTQEVQYAGAKRGARPFSNPGSFVVGGWNKHGTVDGPTDPWIHSYSGSMDQFRLYRKALSASEVTALYNSKL